MWRFQFTIALLLLLILSLSTKQADENAESSLIAWLCGIMKKFDISETPISEIHKHHEPIHNNAIEVKQGNAHARSILLGSTDYLFTKDLTPCIAILIVDEKNHHCHMIHTDAVHTSSIGGTTLKTALYKLGLTKSNPCKIGLIGGASPESIASIQNTLRNILPHAQITISEQGKHTAYLSGHGGMASSKKDFLLLNHHDDRHFTSSM